MGFFLNTRKSKILFILVILLYGFSPLLAWSAGFQEEKLFDGEFYSSEDLREKIKLCNKEIQTLEGDIKALETDVDWLILKINRIQDSGRTAHESLQNSIITKEKKIIILGKTKNRLERLVQHYSSILDTKKEQEPEDILRNNANIKLGKNSQINKFQLQAAIERAGLTDWVEIVGSGTCLRLETTLPILFPTGSARIAKEYTGFFRKLADFLKSYDVKILVSGYADTDPIHNSRYPSNFELGATRAANIVHKLVSYGLKPSIFKIQSTGEHRFTAKKISTQKSFERRAEVTIVFSGLS